MNSVELVHWNPRRTATGRRRLPRALRPRVNNFGDLLGPEVVGRLLRTRGVAASAGSRQGARLLTVGSVMRLALDDDVVWGTGVNGKSLDLPLTTVRLDVRAVRGPLTRAVLLAAGVDVPEVYGDPGLLVGRLWSRDELAGDGRRRPVTVVPNLHDFAAFSGDTRAIDPRSGLTRCLRAIACSDLVVGSSLHGIVVAEALGIPARLVTPGVEPPFKYEDYYRGSGRDGFESAPDVDTAIRMGGEDPADADLDALTEAFPWDLWAARAR